MDTSECGVFVKAPGSLCIIHLPNDSGLWKMNEALRIWFQREKEEKDFHRNTEFQRFKKELSWSISESFRDILDVSLSKFLETSEL